MRISSVEFCCIVCHDDDTRLSLRMESWHTKMFPMTYTVQECLEVWCEEVGWRYTRHGGRLSISEREYYMVIVEMPMYECSTDTIINYVRENER